MLANEDNDKPLGKQDYLGWALWATGMFFEIVADMQKTAFKNDPKNQVSAHHIFENSEPKSKYRLFTQGKFITTGLWSISRHPNYFGEILLWFGLYISASSVFKGWQYLGVLSPLFVHLLITRVSGIPLLEKAGLKKWGHLKEYQEYLKNTPSLVPFWK